MTRVTVHEYAAALRPRYRAARRRDKGESWMSSAERLGGIARLRSGFSTKRAGRKLSDAADHVATVPEVIEPLLLIWEAAMGGQAPPPLSSRRRS